MTRDLTKRQGVRWGRPALRSLQLRARTEGFGGWNRIHCGDCPCSRLFFFLLQNATTFQADSVTRGTEGSRRSGHRRFIYHRGAHGCHKAEVPD
jgi:hypothetical protein